VPLFFYVGRFSLFTSAIFQLSLAGLFQYRRNGVVALAPYLKNEGNTYTTEQAFLYYSKSVFAFFKKPRALVIIVNDSSNFSFVQNEKRGQRKEETNQQLVCKKLNYEKPKEVKNEFLI
jgi:hypothetical protein